MIRHDKVSDMPPYYRIGFYHESKFNNYNYREILIDGKIGEELYVLDRYSKGWEGEGEGKNALYRKQRDLMEKDHKKMKI